VPNRKTQNVDYISHHSSVLFYLHRFFAMNNLSAAYAAHGIGSNEAKAAEQVCKDVPGGQGQKLIDGAKS
jgi:hypothetical protein